MTAELHYDKLQLQTENHCNRVSAVAEPSNYLHPVHRPPSTALLLASASIPSVKRIFGMKK